MPTDWQPHEQLSGGSSPTEDWREPMVDASNSSNPPEIAPPPSHWSDAVTYAVQVEQYIDKLRADGVIAAPGLLDDTPVHEVPANIDEVIADVESAKTGGVEPDGLVASLQSRLARFAARIDRRMAADVRRRQRERQ